MCAVCCVHSTAHRKLGSEWQVKENLRKNKTRIFRTWMVGPVLPPLVTAFYDFSISHRHIRWRAQGARALLNIIIYWFALAKANVCSFRCNFRLLKFNERHGNWKPTHICHFSAVAAHQMEKFNLFRMLSPYTNASQCSFGWEDSISCSVVLGLGEPRIFVGKLTTHCCAMIHDGISSWRWMNIAGRNSLRD